MAPRFLFFGTPEFAVPCLEAVLDLGEVSAVITQPDRPQGRGMTLTAPPVKELALSRGLRVMQPTKVRTAEFAGELRAMDADVAVVVAYGRILPRPVLDAARLGCVNVHGSLLPRWRGAAPIQWAIAAGDAETGVCLMQMDEGMDTGPELARRVLAIGPDETAGSLAPKLANLGASMLREELPRFLRGELLARSQPTEGVTIAPILKKEHGRIDWSKPAPEIHDLVRAMNPWPGAYASLEGGPMAAAQRVKIHRTQVVETESSSAEPGRVVAANAAGIVVATTKGLLRVEELQLEGKKRLAAGPFLAGFALNERARFVSAE